MYIYYLIVSKCHLVSQFIIYNECKVEFRRFSPGFASSPRTHILKNSEKSALQSFGGANRGAN